MNKFLKKVAALILLLLLILNPYFLGSFVCIADDTDAEEEVFYYLTDHLGGIDAVVDENGTVVERTDYLPFGDERMTIGNTDEDYGYTGKEKDDETGLNYYGARYYDSKLGRFTQIDPYAGDLADPQSLNKYSYVLNNPIKFIDPTGNIPKLADVVTKLVNIATFGNFGTDDGWLAQSAKDYTKNQNPETKAALLSCQNEAYSRLLKDPFFSDETWDPISTKRISELDPRVRIPATDLINKTESQQKVQLRVTTGYRDIETQNELYEQGRTKPGKQVTWVKGGDSYHNYRRAIDVVKMEGRQAIWENIGGAIADIGKNLGFEWGGDWEGNKNDPPHFQMTFGESTESLKKKAKK